MRLWYEEIYAVLATSRWNYNLRAVCKEWRDIFDDQCPIQLYEIDERRIKPLKTGCNGWRKPIYTKLYWMYVNPSNFKTCPNYERVITNEETLQYRYNVDLSNQLRHNKWCQVCGIRPSWYAVVPENSVRSTRFMFVCMQECPQVAVEMLNKTEQ